MGDAGGDAVVTVGLPPSPPIFLAKDGPPARAPWLVGVAFAELVCFVAAVVLDFWAFFGPGHFGPARDWVAWQVAPFLHVLLRATVGLPVIMLLLLPRRPPRVYRPLVVGLAALVVLLGAGLAWRECHLRAHPVPAMLSAAESLTVPHGLVAAGLPVLGAVADDRGGVSAVPEVRWFWRAPSSATACQALTALYGARPGWSWDAMSCTAWHRLGRSWITLQAWTPGQASDVNPPAKGGISVSVVPAGLAP